VFLWWLFDHVPLGPFAPWVFRLCMGRMPHRVRPAPREEGTKPQ
jgi:hypothetical protein